jgi:hypothetical protein
MSRRIRHGVLESMLGLQEVMHRPVNYGVYVFDGEFGNWKL